ncbi:MAG: carboxypeptidase-like regulatory domain-containing protein [Candidatus Angelobacter sp.]
MKRRSAIVVCALTGFMYLAMINTTAMAQRGGQATSRTLIGHVLSGRDEPVSKAIVYLKNTKTLMIKTYITDPDGSYHFPALAPNVDYELYAEHQGVRSNTKTLSGFDNRRLVDITMKLNGR